MDQNLTADALRSVQARLAEALSLLRYVKLESPDALLIERLIHGADEAISECMKT